MSIPARRLVIVASAGGEGASTVARVAAAAAAAAGRAGGVLTRADDPDSVVPASAAGYVVADVGPHGSDGTGRPGDVAVLVCAANTGAIERARALLDGGRDGDGERDFAVLVVTARTAAEGRRSRVRMQQAASDSRILLLPYDPALRSTGGGGPAAATSSIGERLVALLDA